MKIIHKVYIKDSHGSKACVNFEGFYSQEKCENLLRLYIAESRERLKGSTLAMSFITDFPNWVDRKQGLPNGKHITLSFS